MPFKKICHFDFIRAQTRTDLRVWSKDWQVYGSMSRPNRVSKLSCPNVLPKDCWFELSKHRPMRPPHLWLFFSRHILWLLDSQPWTVFAYVLCFHAYCASVLKQCIYFLCLYLYCMGYGDATFLFATMTIVHNFCWLSDLVRVVLKPSPCDSESCAYDNKMNLDLFLV